MGKQKSEESLTMKRSREEVAKYLMQIRLQEAEHKAREYARTLDPRESIAS